MTEEHYWNEADFIRMERSLMVSLGFSFEDIQALSVKGLPEWTAPNLNFDVPVNSNGNLVIGEDRNDNQIFIELSTLRVLVGDGKQLMNSSGHLLRKTLKLYAVLVEKATVLDENAFIDNQIPNDFIEAFHAKLALLDPVALAKGCFWQVEICRLLNHTEI